MEPNDKSIRGSEQKEEGGLYEIDGDRVRWMESVENHL